MSTCFYFMADGEVITRPVQHFDSRLEYRAVRILGVCDNGSVTVVKDRSGTAKLGEVVPPMRRTTPDELDASA